jgi:hypothetical protein
VDLSQPYLAEEDCHGTVYVPQLPLTSNGGVGSVRPRIDLRPAERYGKLVYLCDWENLDGIDTAAILFELRGKLKDYCDDDYLLMVGAPTLMALTALVAAEVNDGKVRLLYWRREQRRYVVVDIDMDAIPPR